MYLTQTLIIQLENDMSYNKNNDRREIYSIKSLKKKQVQNKHYNIKNIVNNYFFRIVFFLKSKALNIYIARF